MQFRVVAQGIERNFKYTNNSINIICIDKYASSLGLSLTLIMTRSQLAWELNFQCTALALQRSGFESCSGLSCYYSSSDHNWEGHALKKLVSSELFVCLRSSRGILWCLFHVLLNKPGSFTVTKAWGEAHMHSDWRMALIPAPLGIDGRSAVCSPVCLFPFCSHCNTR